MTLKYGKNEITFTLSKNNVHIVDSYKITKSADMLAIVNRIRSAALKLGFRYRRSNSSWITEWKAHNYMYDKGIERARTASVDFDENVSVLKLISYSLMAALYRKG